MLLNLCAPSFSGPSWPAPKAVMLFFAVDHECHHGGPHWMPLISSAFVQHKDHHQIPMPEADRGRIWEARQGSGRDPEGMAE
jgi:hypothetical protein